MMSGISQRTTAFRVLALLLILLPVALAFVGQSREHWLRVYDDAFITYRYADNLADGHGITWNRGEAPTEGYTNFLLVVTLAPAIRAGADPLLLTRILSYLAALGIGILLYREARRRPGSSRFAALLIGILPLAAGQTRLLCLVGLETVIYAFFLLATLLAGVGLIRRNTAGGALAFALLGIVTFLLRPEALLVFPVIVIAVVLRQARSGEHRYQPVVAASLLATVLLAAYFTWKLGHFGTLLPNPFYVKAGSELFSGRGAWSVRHFMERNPWLMAAWALSFLLAGRSVLKKSGESGAFWPVSVFALLNLFFFLRTETLMDIEGRFLYPLLPVLIYAILPLLAGLLERLEKDTSRWRLALFLPAVFLFLVDPATGLEIPDNLRFMLRGNPAAEADRSLERREQVAGIALSAWPGIEDLRIAFGDAGTIPYYSGALHLDMVGLNDGFIAREKDKGRLVDYFFGQRPDLVLHPAIKSHRWISYGHGPLGDYASWARDSRWDDYRYVGTLRTEGRLYDIHLLVRADMEGFDAFSSFLLERVADGRWRELPLPLGGYQPGRELRPLWVPASSKIERNPVEVAP